MAKLCATMTDCDGTSYALVTAWRGVHLWHCKPVEGSDPQLIFELAVMFLDDKRAVETPKPMVEWKDMTTIRPDVVKWFIQIGEKLLLRPNVFSFSMYVEFPRYAVDITTRRRTVYHTTEGGLHKGNGLCIVSSHNAPRGELVEITDVGKVKLSELSAADFDKLGGVTVEEYRARWDAANPNTLWESDPEVYCIEFRYLGQLIDTELPKPQKN